MSNELKLLADVVVEVWFVPVVGVPLPGASWVCFSVLACCVAYWRY
jgi:hypothetical protein